MNSDIDILKQLEVKNREIYINKLNIDLDNNKEILLITIDNVINLFIEEVTNKILEIKNDKTNKENVLNQVTKFYNKIKEEIDKLLENRYNNLKENISNNENSNYQDILDKEKEKIINKIKNVYNEAVDNIIKGIEEIYKEPNNRINDYLKILNYDKFINKIKDVSNNMNIILCNSFIESNNKYQELNSKTLNK